MRLPGKEGILLSSQPWEFLDVPATCCRKHRRLLPTPLQLAMVKPGDYLKVSADWPVLVRGKRRENFWVQVVALRPWGYLAVVANDLEMTDVHGLDNGMTVEIEYRHVCTTIVPQR